ncbi:MAG: N-6 DNA methylase, partial [Candidatus Parabeggiatoa sp.]|nr:N-6 DNA methylase [Candidatus Parabeggiatoa sp.]
MYNINQIKKLQERFSQKREIYQQADYTEAQTRIDFINPFFTALGWDVDNKAGLTESYRQVVYEDRLKIDKAPYKHPDYSFRVGGVRKFFVEAKKPSISLSTDSEAAYQIRRYGWNAKLSLSILTNFAEWAVYDCRIKPEKDDDPSIGRVWYLKYTDYLEHWDALVERFSYDAVWQGKFDQYAAETLIKKGVIEVDTAFLNEMEAWREKLAHHILSNNASLTQRQLNIVVQQTIDRIIFLRICEDRGIEDYGRLLGLTNGPSIYKRLFELFTDADERYNSGLFHFKTEKGREAPDNLTPSLKIGDDVLKNIIFNLYYPISPYEFSVLPADILGQVYERFLGKVIRLTTQNQAVIEEKPEVKKAGGVYYTPRYIVDYIVKQSVGKLLDSAKIQANGFLNKLLGNGKQSASRLKILDPACGSGSFLLGVYQFLLDWHLEQYLLEPNKFLKGKKPRLYQAIGGTWKLTLSERKRILLNNIYGVDIDPQAVEVTKLSLLLKVLEDEKSVISQLSLFKERVLPDINNNIKCGNSLIGHDFYQETQLALIDEETQYRINAFDWESEFHDVMQAGGFDAVIGNPPYVLIANRDEKKYLQSFYKLSTGKPDLYRYFIERSHKLLQKKGQFGFIIPNTLLTIPASQKLREYLLGEGGLTQIVNFWGPVFSKVSVNSIILFTIKSSTNPVIEVIEDTSELPSTTTLSEAIVHKRLVDKKTWLHDEHVKFSLSSSQKIVAFFDKIKTCSVELSSLARYTLGMQVYHNSKHSPQEMKERVYHSEEQKNDTFWLESTGRNILRYHFVETFQNYVAFGEWCYSKPSWEFCSEPRILIREIPSKTLVCTATDTVHIPTKAVIIVIPEKVNLYYLLGILNSKLIGFYVQSTGEKGKQRLFPRISLTTTRKLPIYKIDLSKSTDKAKHKQMVQLVKQMLALNKQ